ncbi:hypothetical protein MRX96_004561 [Rhipicephalus microplus]
MIYARLKCLLFDSSGVSEALRIVNTDDGDDFMLELWKLKRLRHYGILDIDTRAANVRDLLRLLQNAVNTAAAAAMDTTPPAPTNDDLTFPSNDDSSAWVVVQKKRRTQADLSVSQPNSRLPEREVRITNWDNFQELRTASPEVDGYDDWLAALTADLDGTTKSITTTPIDPDVDPHLLDLRDAKRGLTKRWKR